MAGQSGSEASTGPVRHDAASRAAAVARSRESDVTVAAVAREWQVSPSTVRRWIASAATEESVSTPEPAASGVDEADRGAASRVPVLKPVAFKAEAPDDTATKAPGDEVFPRLSQLTHWQRFPSLLILWSVCLLIAAAVPEDYPLRSFALVAHVVGLVVALGTVIVVDWHGLLWMWRLRGLPETTRLAAGAGPLIWLGLTVLMVSGALLKPDLTRPLTVLKILLVLVVAFNGAALSALRRRLAKLPPDTDPRSLSRRDWVLMTLATTISQIGWWGAAVIGFMTSLG